MKKKKRSWLAAIGMFAFCLSCGGTGERAIVVGSKNFTEQSLLGELLAQQVERTLEKRVDRRFYLGGTLICHNALVAGEIDMYVEYTGTAFAAILKEEPLRNAREVYERTRDHYRSQFGIELLPPLGFNNTFAILIRGEEARSAGLKTLSDITGHTPRWQAAFGPEFMERADGFRGLAEMYDLRFARSPRIMDLGLTYRALAEGKVDLIAGDATNGLIESLDLFMLEDDRHYFPPYEAVPFVRQETLQRNTGLREGLEKLAGTISDQVMRRLNYAVDGLHRPQSEVVKEFLDSLP